MTASADSQAGRIPWYAQCDQCRDAGVETEGVEVPVTMRAEDFSGYPIDYQYRCPVDATHSEWGVSQDAIDQSACSSCGADLPGAGNGAAAADDGGQICQACVLDEWDHAPVNQYGNPISPPRYEDGTVAVPAGRDWNAADPQTAATTPND